MHVPLTDVILSHDGVELVRATLKPGEYVIGSEDGVDLHAKAALISRQHARLTINYDHMLLEDLGSTNGTYVNERRVAAATRVFPSQAIRLGDVRLEVHRQRTPSEPGVSLAPAQAVIQRFVPDELLVEKRYAIGGIVAEGGMGVILDARQSAMKRTVAMKVMLDGSAEASVLRFIEEAQITGQLEHPNIVPVHEIGVDEQQQLYYTMKFVRGTTLKKVLDLLAAGNAAMVRKYPLSALLTILQKVCDAIAFAHSKAVIHRDIKPENIMLGDFGEVLVLDWGLAKVIGKSPAPAPDFARSAIQSARVASPAKASETENFATMPGSIVGTAQYMAPEQAHGTVETLDHRADIYALGGLLYYALTLRPAISGASVEAILTKVRAGKITPPERILTRSRRSRSEKAARQRIEPSPAAPEQDPTLLESGPPPGPAAFQSGEPAKAAIALAHLPGERVPESLSAVCMKALALDPEARYQRVERLQADLSAYQNGFATSAESASGWRQFTLLLKRHRAVSTAIAASLLLLAVISALYTTRVVQERNTTAIQRDRAETASVEAGAQRNASEDRLYFSHMLLAGKDLADGRPENARHLLDRHTSEPSGRDLRDWEWYFLYGQLNQEALRVQAHHGGANGLAASRDGSRAATVGDDGSVAIWEVDGFRETARWTAHDQSALCVAWSPDMAYLATGDVTGVLRLWEIATRKKAAEIRAPSGGAVRAVAWHPDPSGLPRLAIAGDCKEILLWKPFESVSESNPELIAKIKTGTHALSFSLDGSRLAAGLADGRPATAVFDVATKARVFGFDASAGSDIHAIAFNPKNGLIAAGSKHLYVNVYDPAPQPRTISSRPLHRGFISSLAWNPDGTLLASGSHDGTIRLTKPLNPTEAPLILAGDVRQVNALAWVGLPAREPGGKPTSTILSVNADGTLRAWLAERVNGQTFAASAGNWVARAKWNPAGTRLAVASFREAVTIHDLATGEVYRQLKGGAHGIFDVAWSPDGTRIASAGRHGGAISIFDVESGVKIRRLQQPKPTRVAWSSDGRYLVACGNDLDTRVWDTEGGKLLQIIARPAGQAEWHPDGRRLALGCRNGALEIWDGLEGKRIAIWRHAPAQAAELIVNEMEPPRQIADLAWSWQGDRLAYVTQDTVAAVLASNDGALLQEFTGHTGGIYEVVWSGDGRRLATSGQDGSVRIYNSSTGDQVAVVQHGEGMKEVHTLDWSRDGRSLATGGFDRSTRVWDTNRGRDLAAAHELQRLLSQRPSDVAVQEDLAARAARLGWVDTARALALRAKPEVATAVENELAIALDARSGWRPPTGPTPLK